MWLIIFEYRNVHFYIRGLHWNLTVSGIREMGFLSFSAPTVPLTITIGALQKWSSKLAYKNWCSWDGVGSIHGLVWKTNGQIRQLHKCAAWSDPSYVAMSWNRFSHETAHLFFNWLLLMSCEKLVNVSLYSWLYRWSFWVTSCSVINKPQSIDRVLLTSSPRLWAACLMKQILFWCQLLFSTEVLS